MTTAKESQEHRDKVKRERAENVKSNQFLGTMLSKATFAEKVEAVREVNPFFYLLTPKPSHNKTEGDNDENS